jgi:hypothetical protein
MRKQPGERIGTDEGAEVNKKAARHRGNAEGSTAQTTARPSSTSTGIRGRELSTSKRTSTSAASRLASTYSARFIRGVYWGRRDLAATFGVSPF